MRPAGGATVLDFARSAWVLVSPAVFPVALVFKFALVWLFAPEVVVVFFEAGFATWFVAGWGLTSVIAWVAAMAAGSAGATAATA